MSHYIRPLGTKIVVQQASKAKFVGKSKLIEAAESYAEAPSYGTVMAVGPAVKDVKVGDFVIWSRYAGIEGPSVDTRENQVIIMEEDEIFAGFDKAQFDAEVEAAAAAEKKREDEARATLDAQRQVMLAQSASTCLTPILAGWIGKGA